MLRAWLQGTNRARDGGAADNSPRPISVIYLHMWDTKSHVIGHALPRLPVTHRKSLD